MKKIYAFFLLFAITLAAFAQVQSPVSFTVSQKRISVSEIDIVFKGKIAAGWHVYSTGLPAGGPTSASFSFDKKNGVEAVGKLKHIGKESSAFDEIFEMNVRYFEGTVTFVQRVRLTRQEYSASGYLEYGACNDQNCTPPTSVNFSLAGKDGVAAAAASPSAVEKNTPDAVDSESPAPSATSIDSTAKDTVKASSVNAADTNADYWKPVADKLQSLDGSASYSSRAWWAILLLGFAGGLLALFTPCVWPIIPMTVSFFLKRADNKRKGIRDALTYGVAIIVIYLALGLLITGIFGASSLNALSTNAVFNILFFLMLVVFAASFMGGFEITLPSSWSNTVDSKAEKTTGLISIFLMAFTLSLVSFSCTGPIIGFLLVEASTTGSIVSPAIGMFGFALALALPFTLFAMFPAWLKSAPKSGSWMNCIKVTLGFLELAFALKFLSVADLAYGWGLLDRETFLALWIVIFALLGLYLLGKIKFPHDDDDGRTNVPRFFMALCSLAFAVYMVPGLWGAPLKAVSAFAPPMHTQDFNLDNNEVKPQFTSYEEGMAYAASVGKPVLLDFTGHGCVNCRKMELAVWYDRRVADIIEKDYVLISLFVDDKDRLAEPIEVTEASGDRRTLRTVGDKWSYLQRSKFGAQTQPFYVLLDGNAEPLTGAYSYDENVDKYVSFLKTGLERYNAVK